MNKKFPDSSKMFFLFCDDIRREQGNKLSLMGVYAGGNLLLRSENIVLPQICFYFRVDDGEGKFKIKFKVLDAEGNTVADSGNADIEHEFKEGKLNSIFFNVPGIKFPKFGKYRVLVLLDDKEYIREFEVVKWEK